MNCKQIDALMLDFLEGELSRRDKKAVEEHLSACWICEEQARETLLLQKNLKVAFRLEAAHCERPAGVWNQIQGYIREHTPAAQTPARSKGRFFFPQKLTWDRAIIGGLVATLVIVAATTIPPLFEPSMKVRAAEIALRSDQVQQALGGLNPLDVTVLETFEEDGKLRVYIEATPGKFIIADVDMSNQELVSMRVHEISEVTQQLVVDIARTDKRVQALFDQGAVVKSLEMYESFPAGIKLWREEYSRQLGINGNDLVGLIGCLSIGMSESQSDTLCVINTTTNKVVAVYEPSHDMGTVVEITPVVT